MSQPELDTSLRPKIGLALGPLLFLFLLLVPTPHNLQPEAMRMAAVAALMAVWWITEAIPIPATALLPLPLFPLLGILPAAETPLSYADRMIYLFFGGFTIAIAMQQVGLHKRIALHIIRAIGSSPSRLLLGFMVASAFLSLWISNTATTMMMLPIAMAVVLQMSGNSNEQDGKRFRETFGLVLMLGIAYAASIGGIGTLVGTPPNIVMAGFVKKLFPDAPEINFLKWMLVGLPVVITFVPITWLFLVRKGCAVDLRKIEGIDQQSGAEYIEKHLIELGKMRWGEKAVATVFLLTALGWIFRAPLELGFYTTWGLSKIFPMIDDSTVAMTMGLSLFLIPADRGSGQRFLLDWKAVRNGMPWGVLILYGGGFALARGMEVSGLALWLGQQLTWLSSVPDLVIIMATCLMLTFLTEITSNTATTTMLVPVLASAAVAMGIHPFLLMIPATISASCAFMLPVATPPNAVVFGSGWVRIPDMARVGFWLNLIGVVLVTVIVYTIGLWVFDIQPGVVPEWARHLAAGQ